jgi:hypothetical protein
MVVEFKGYLLKIIIDRILRSVNAKADEASNKNKSF